METDTSETPSLLWDCLFCSKKFQHILELPCRHTFCEPCLRSWINIYLCFDDYGGLIDRFPCRICWKIFQVPPAGLGALKQCHPIEQLQELLNSMSMQDPAQDMAATQGPGGGAGPSHMGQDLPMESSATGPDSAPQSSITVVDECFHCGTQHYSPVQSASHFHV